MLKCVKAYKYFFHNCKYISIMSYQYFRSIDVLRKIMQTKSAFVYLRNNSLTLIGASKKLTEKKIIFMVQVTR